MAQSSSSNENQTIALLATFKRTAHSISVQPRQILYDENNGLDAAAHAHAHLPHTYGQLV
jgi:hypothetical protein